MAEYSLTLDPAIVKRTSDGAFIPTDERNADYQAYLEWLDAGNEPDPFIPPATSKPGPKSKRG